jgi:RNA polymerase sigma-70 factor, ECF subfamily
MLEAPRRAQPGPEPSGEDTPAFVGTPALGRIGYPIRNLPDLTGRQEGGVTEFSALYQKHAREVYRFALYLSGDRSEAEDITSETFVRVWTSPEPVRLATVRGYLFTIARNLFLQGLRRRSRHRALDETLADPRPDPQADAEGRAELEATLAALHKLPEVDRSAVLMRALEGLPYEEIARALGISVAAAKVKVHRARRALLELGGR